MLRAIWFLIKAAVVVAAAVWVSNQKGHIVIDVPPYTATFHIGVFLLFILTVTVLGIVLFALFKTIFDAPKNWQRYKDMTGKDKGLRALTIGLSAVAAGDSKSALYQSYRAGKFLGEGEALVRLLMAQSARLAGDEVEAGKDFAMLLDDKDAGFLGVRGLLQSALDHGDYQGARELGYKALEMQPKQPWILRIVYDIEIRLRNWDCALKVLYTAEKCGAIPVNKANSDRVAMLLAQADIARDAGDEVTLFRTLQKAYKYDSRFVPSVVRLAQMYLDRGKRKAAVSMISEAWRFSPHPELVPLWGAAMPEARENDKMAQVRWFEKLLELKPDSVEGLMALAGALIREDLWGEARKALEKAEKIRPNVNLYKLWSMLEERATRDSDAVRGWLEKAADAPRERVWICSETGRIYDHWVPISDLGLFNTIIWDFPVGRSVGVSALTSSYSDKDAAKLLEAPV